MNYRTSTMLCIIVNKYDKSWLVGIAGVVFNCNDWSIIDDFVHTVTVNFVFFLRLYSFNGYKWKEYVGFGTTDIMYIEELSRSEKAGLHITWLYLFILPNSYQLRETEKKFVLQIMYLQIMHSLDKVK